MNWLRNFGLYLVHTIVASIGVLVVCILVAAMLANLNKGVADAIFAGPVYPAEIVVGMLAGFAVNRFLCSKSAKWAWVIPSLPIFYDLYCYAHLGWTYTLSYMFLGRCSDCVEQILTTAPFYSSIAYSLGAWAALRLSAARDGTEPGK